MSTVSRRALLRVGTGWVAGGLAAGALAAEPIERQAATDDGVEVINPEGRVPLSFFIDDSTCLVNMGCYCMPQFAEAWPDQQIYRKPWKSWPREIPDAFLREFGSFCAEHGVKGKFSIVPNPACVGWLDRELPGWSRQELRESLKLVRELMLPNWDIHPEMITHTRVIDLQTGRALEQISSATMENSYPQAPKRADELAAYIAYALKILKNCELPCEGITTPGGFGNRATSELSLGVQQSVRDVFRAEIPHYFKYVVNGRESPQPRLEHVQAADSDSPQLTVSIPAGTGDWFGNWDGDADPQGARYANQDATAGRMVELIERGGPAIMLCHWPGLYSHGTKKGFEQFKQVAKALDSRYRDRTIWMKITEIARYWAAKGLTRIARDGADVTLAAPFASPRFTLKIKQPPARRPKISHGGQPIALEEVREPGHLARGRWIRQNDHTIVCFDLQRGQTRLEWV